MMHDDNEFASENLHTDCRTRRTLLPTISGAIKEANFITEPMRSSCLLVIVLRNWTRFNQPNLTNVNSNRHLVQCA